MVKFLSGTIEELKAGPWNMSDEQTERVISLQKERGNPQWKPGDKLFFAFRDMFEQTAVSR